MDAEKRHSKIIRRTIIAGPVNLAIERWIVLAILEDSFSGEGLHQRARYNAAIRDAKSIAQFQSGPAYETFLSLSRARTPGSPDKTSL